MLKDAVFCYVVARYGTAQYAILFVACHCFSNSYMRLYHALLPCVVLYPVVSSCNMLFWYPSLLFFSALSCMLVLHVLFSCILSYYVVLHYSTSSGVRLYHAASLYIYIFISLSLSSVLAMSLQAVHRRHLRKLPKRLFGAELRKRLGLHGIMSQSCPSIRSQDTEASTVTSSSSEPELSP